MGYKMVQTIQDRGANGSAGQVAVREAAKGTSGMMSKVRQKARETDCWTLHDMSEHIREYTGVEYSESHVRRILAALGVRHEGARNV